MRVISRMKWSPVINAAAAVGYIVAVGLFLRFLESIRHDTPDTLLDGVGAISLFVFSAAVMSYLFFSQPLIRLIDGKKAEAASYFLTTLALFGAATTTLIAFVSLQ